MSTVPPETQARAGAAPLQATGLACAIGRRRILSGVDLEVRAGEVLGLVGANGSGKSTLLRVLGGVRPAAEGHVTVAGRRLSSMRTLERARQLALVAQEEAGATDLLVGEMVALGRVPHGRAWGAPDVSDREAVLHALSLVDLGYAVDQPLDRLSGGERRRALIARGLAQEAPVLLLDEPTNHLDVRHQLALMRRVRALATDRGRAVVVAMHDLDLAWHSCDRIAVLHEGRVVACGTPPQALTRDLLHDVFGVLASHVTHPVSGRTHLLFSHDESESH